MDWRVVSILMWERINSVWRDAVFALRSCRHQRLTFAVATASLAIALGTGTAIFSLLDAIVLRPFGVAEPDSLLQVSAHENGRLTGWTLAGYARIRSSSSASVVAIEYDSAIFAPNREDDATGRNVRIGFVSGDYMQALRARTVLGRSIVPTDDSTAAAPVAVVSHLFWSRALGADPSVVGREMLLGAVTVTIVGVVEKRFSGPTDRTPAFWVPLTYRQPIVGTEPDSVLVYARLRDGVTIAHAENEIAAVASGLRIDRANGTAIVTGARLQPVERRHAEGDVGVVRLLTLVVLVLIAMLVTVASANVATLLLAWGNARGREIGLRLALGASRWRIVRQMLTESTLLGLAAGLGGVPIAIWVVSLLGRFGGVPREFADVVDVTPDLRVYAFLGFCALASSVLAGLVPARHGVRSDLRSPLGGSSTAGVGYGGKRSRATLVALQAAISVVFLVLATLLGRSAVEATRIDPGFDAGRLLVVSANLPRNRGGEAQPSRFWQRSELALQGVAGIERTAIVRHAPFDGGSQVFLDAEHGRLRLFINATSASYFETVGLRLVKGRPYSPTEVASAANVVVVSAALARRYWPASDPIGDTLGRVHESMRSWTVIGVVGDARTERISPVSEEVIYRPLSTSDWRNAHLLIATSGPASHVLASVNAAIRSVDAAVRPEVALVSEALLQQMEPPRLMANLTVLLAVVSLALAAAGFYGVAAFAIGRRAREMAVRIALGATRTALIAQLARDLLRPVLIGAAAGLVVAFLSSALVSSVLYGIGPRDPMSFAGATLVLTAVLLTAIVPTLLRATRASPADELKNG